MTNIKKKAIDSKRQDIGAMLRSRRQELNLSLQAVSDQTGIRKGTIIDIEHGRPCELNTLLTILSLFNGAISIKW